MDLLFWRINNTVPAWFQKRLIWCSTHRGEAWSWGQAWGQKPALVRLNQFLQKWELTHPLWKAATSFCGLIISEGLFTLPWSYIDHSFSTVRREWGTTNCRLASSFSTPTRLLFCCFEVRSAAGDCLTGDLFPQWFRWSPPVIYQPLCTVHLQDFSTFATLSVGGLNLALAFNTIYLLMILQFIISVQNISFNFTPT